MISKEIYLLTISVTYGICLLGQFLPTNLVHPMVGTDFNGHTFPGATTPHGMVQLSPDTRIDGSWAGCSGYHYSDSLIYGFSHTHLSGTGCSDYGDILIMPLAEYINWEPEEYAAKFKHENEHAEAGYYSVQFDNKIKAELTTTTRTGFHKYTYSSGPCSIIIDLNHRDRLKKGSIQLIDERTISIKRVSAAWAQNQHCYAYIKFNTSYLNPRFNEDSTKLILNFEKDKVLLTKVGLSFTGVEGAKMNLEAEIPDWDFNRVRNEAKKAWNDALNAIEVRDDDLEKMRVFYTALYHVMIHPNVAMDVDGTYRGMDDQLHKAKNFTYYTVFSLWDTFRAEHPLFTIIDRKRTLDYIKTFLAMYEQGGRLPVWELCSNETDCMIGYHSVSVITDALMKGIDDFDVELAYEAMCASANWNHLGLPEYINHGFLSIEDEHESVSKTLEYAYDDWCIAQVAMYLQKDQDAINYQQRSWAWKNLIDPETHLMRPRRNGGWIQPFDPREVNNYFTEGNSWQYSFFVPQDVIGMMDEMGGCQSFEKQLDALFTAPTETTGRTQADISGLIGQYAHGNEPSHHIAWLYDYIKKPEKTTQRVHQILHDFYSSKPDGLIGNEDCGQMSAWYVMSAMGIYAVCPGKPEYAICEPYLDDYTVRLENGKTFTKADVVAAYDQGYFINHFALIGEPEKVKPIQRVVVQDPYLVAPIISAMSETFDDSLLVSVSLIAAAQEVRYDISNAYGLSQKEQTQSPFYIHESSTIRAYTAYSDNSGTFISKPVEAKFYKSPNPEWKATIINPYDPQYSAGGDRALIDGIYGEEDWRKGYWQGYQGQDFQAVIDLGALKTVRQLSSTYLQDTRSWIFFPTNVEYQLSEDGEVFKPAGGYTNKIDPQDSKVSIQGYDVILTTPKQARFVKITAHTFGKLPVWHQGAGGDSFIFVDEVNVE